MDYFFTKDGQKKQVQMERWAWAVIYNDGTEFKQFADDGTFHQIGEIDQDKIAMAVLYRPDRMLKRIDIPWRKGMKLIHLYRTMVFDMQQPGERRAKIYIFGYKDGDHHHYNYILPDDRIVCAPDDIADLTKFEV